MTELQLLKNRITKLESLVLEQQQKYEYFYDNAPDMYFSIDKNSKVVSVNKNGATYLGYKKSELLGKEIWKVVYKNDLNRVKRQISRIVNNSSNTYELEFRKVKKDGSIIYVHEQIRCSNDNNKNMELRIVCRDITDQKKTHQKLLDYQENLKVMTQELNSIEDNTKQQIAIKLHDNIGQSMALSKITLSNISKDMNYSEIEKNVNSAISLLTDAIKNSRDLTYEISPPILHELGLGEAVKWYIKQIRKIFDIKFRLQGIQEADILTQNTKILLYKSVVELINNIIKHSNASIVIIIFKEFKNTFRIIVKDNGIGFKIYTEQKLSKDKKFGLFSINERIRYIGGKFKIESDSKKGTKITIKIPIER